MSDQTNTPDPAGETLDEGGATLDEGKAAPAPASPPKPEGDRKP